MHEVTCLWLHDTSANQHWNLLTIIEEVAPGQPLSEALSTIDAKGRHHPLLQARLNNGQWRVNAVRYTVECIEEAEALYRGDQGVRSLTVGSTVLKISAIGQEQAYPPSGTIPVPPLSEVQLNEEANPLQKVLPERDVTAHACVRMVCEPLHLPDADTCRAAFTFAKEWLGVDFDDVAEMLGASVWSQPNRLLQALEWGIGPHNILTLAAILRPGVELPGLLVTVWCGTDLGIMAWQGGAAS